ncbi:MAG TPA: hypothetical protein VE291_08575 [Terracidiphilus sp.]|jgi:hypothetical protein|nr:hypothetical protein [Terracidiphilus sp.]
MYSFRRCALALALFLPAAPVLLSQESSSAPAPQEQAQQPQPTSGELSVQARIRARREQRRAQAIKDNYGHLYEAFVGGGYLRFEPGPTLQKLTLYSWDVALTRYYNSKLGVTVDGRGYYGTAYVGLNETAITRPAISVYSVLGGPTYRFYERPRYSLSARALGGVAIGNFTGDTNGFGSIQNPNGPGDLLYANSATYAFSPGIVGETNISPTLALRLSGDYYLTGFGSATQSSFGFTYGFVYRFGKQ